MIRWPSILVVALSCGGEGSTLPLDAAVESDVGVQDGSERDGGEDDGGEPDAVDAAAPDACTRVTLSDWELVLSDDVSVGYEASLNPSVGPVMRFGLLFERRSIGPDIGTFDFGEGDDANFGSCSHCAYAWIDQSQAYYADRGSLVTRADPYAFALDLDLTGVRLVESTIDRATRGSTPIPDGACIEIEDVTVDLRFGPPGWTCSVDDYNDGLACHCLCGAFDPDCGSGECPPFDPGCVPRDPLPIADCGAGEVCTFNPIQRSMECSATCDWENRTACEDGTCVFSFGVGPDDTCEPPSDILDSAMFEQPCQSGGLQKVCNVVDGFALGYCDFGDVCRPVCEADDDCTAPHTCRRFLGDEGLGFCGGPPPADG